jgi:uncharacterized protein GlcG (DUF336 family)
LSAGRVLLLEGGVAVAHNYIGGVGVSGSHWETDLRIAKVAGEQIGASWE